PGHDEGTIRHALDLADARADRRPEYHEIKRGRDNRRHHALQQRTAGARHLEFIDRLDRRQIHLSRLTRSTKMSSSELCFVSRSLKVIPAEARSVSSLVMPVRGPCVS